MKQTRKMTEETKPHAGVTLRVPDLTRILIVCENDSHTERLTTVFGQAGWTSERANSITAACELAKSGRFQLVFTAPHLVDGSWKRLIDLASQHDLGFELILLARTFDLNEWSEALQIGAFEVLDVLCDLPQAAEAAKRAFGTAYLKHFRPRPEPVVGQTG